jgi:CheY-like chemotaxis protein
MGNLTAGRRGDASFSDDPKERSLCRATVKAPENDDPGDGSSRNAAVARDASGSPPTRRGIDHQCPQGCLAKPKCGGPIRRARIAVVDTDERLQCALRAVLDDLAWGWIIEQHLSGRDALKAIPLNPPCAVLMEIALPDISGTECARRVKGLLPALPVVMHTAQTRAWEGPDMAEGEGREEESVNAARTGSREAVRRQRDGRLP